MALRLFRRRRAGFWDPGASPVAEGRRDKPDMAGRRAFMSGHVLLHTHLPKTGGSTLSHGLAGIVGAVHSMDLRLNRRVTLEEMTPEDFAALGFLSGHFPYGIDNRFPERRALYFAAVREPVTRAVSAYRFLQSHDDHPDHPIVKGLGFEDAWEALRKAHGKEADNVQARQLTATHKRADVDEEALWPRVENDYFLVIPQAKITRALQKLRGAYGVPWTRIPQHNVSRGNEVEVSTEMRSRILAANRIDLELHARVSEDFDTHLQRACDYVASHCLLPLEGPQT